LSSPVLDGILKVLYSRDLLVFVFIVGKTDAMMIYVYERAEIIVVVLGHASRGISEGELAFGAFPGLG
jgi:hypothetical protein